MHPNKSQMTSFFLKKEKHSYQTRPDKLTQDLQSYPSLNLAKPRPAIGLDKTVWPAGSTQNPSDLTKPGIIFIFFHAHFFFLGKDCSADLFFSLRNVDMLVVPFSFSMPIYIFFNKMKNQIYRYFFFVACQRTFLCGTLSDKQVVLTGMDNNNNKKK